MRRNRANSTGGSRACRLAIVATHPIQYFAPWFGHLASQPDLDLKVFYLWDFGIAARPDPEFRRQVQWDIPLLEGYESEFVPNVSAKPGANAFRGLDNPQLVDRLVAWGPEAIVLFGYRYVTHLRLMLSPRLASVPLLMRGDSNEIGRGNGLATWVNRQARRIAFRRFDAVLAVGKANTDYFRRAGVPASKIHFVPHCVDNARFSEGTLDAGGRSSRRSELGIGSGSRLVLFAGKLSPEKRPLDLLAAFIAMGRNPAYAHLDAKLVFVGSGELEDALRAAAGDRMGRSVFLLPFKNQSEMPAVYSACDVLVLPSISETWGLAVNEAMSVGLPVIVSDHVGCHPDLVVEGVTGWTFPAGDTDRLSALLGTALADPIRLERMGAAAQGHVAKYSYEVATANLLGTLRSLLRRDSVGTAA